jgi:hypothetical protein
VNVEKVPTFRIADTLPALLTRANHLPDSQRLLLRKARRAAGPSAKARGRKKAKLRVEGQRELLPPIPGKRGDATVPTPLRNAG